MSVVLQNFRRHVKKCSSLRSVSQQAECNKELSQKIKIPTRIPRGPTDILKALAGTLQPDPTGVHYKYHDDPFLIPASQFTKRSYALAKESGRKAAQWVRQEHADLFQHKVAVPFIPSYAPRAVYNDESDVNETVLKSLIDSAFVSDAILVYELLQKKNIDVSEEAKQSLLELVCFYNCKDQDAEDLLEEKWYKGSKIGHARKTWTDGGFADMLFKSMKVQTPEAYCALIQGMAKHHQVSQALALYEEMMAKQLPVSANTFNALICVSHFVKEAFDLRWTFVESLLKEMVAQNCAPNLGTLNATLTALAMMATAKDSQRNALRIIEEFRKLGIEPSLASFYHLMRIMYRREGATPPTLSQVISYLENKRLTARDPEDVNFFAAAMNLCATKLEDVNLAYRLNSLLHYADNYDLIGDSFKESLYYRNFFNVVCDSEPIEEIMKLYEAVVPRIYTPELSVMLRIIGAVDMNGSVEYLPQLWSDIVLFDFSGREEVLTEFCDALYKNSTTELPICEQLADVAWAIWVEIENQSDRRRIKIVWTGAMIGSVLQATLNAKRLKNAYTIFQKLRKSQDDILGIPEVNTLNAFLDAVIENGDGKGALVCLNYCLENDLPATLEMCEKLLKTSILSELQKLEVEKHLQASKLLKEKVESQKQRSIELVK